MQATTVDLDGAIDLHVHAAPDVRTRKADMLEVAQAAAAAGMRAVLLKSHHEHTAGHAFLVNKVVGREIAYGGVTLNRYVGGLNPDAVEAAAALGGRMVWLPTFTSAQHLRYHEEPSGKGLAVVDDSGRLTSAAQAVLDVVAARGLALATGHLAPEETRLLVPEARRRGVRVVVVTHPETGFVNVPVALQKELAAIGGVFFERCRNTSPGRAGELPTTAEVDLIARNIHEVGAETTVLSTDFGQPENPLPVDGLRRYHAEMLERGVSAADLQRMTRSNPSEVLGI